MNEITVSNNAVADVEDFKSIATDYLRGMGMSLPQKYANQFLEICKAYKLNPFKRECYAVGYGENWNIITGYEVYIKRAERSGKLDGWECHVEGTNDNDLRAVITIHRKDWSHPFVHIVYYTEAVQKKRDGSINSMWVKMKTFMLRKVCIAQGFRLCFPDELGGMPYTNDEMGVEESAPNIERNITQEASAQTTNKVMSDNRQKLQKILENYGDKMRDDVYEDCCNALKGDDENDITDKLNRCYPYFAAKGIQVAV